MEVIKLIQNSHVTGEIGVKDGVVGKPVTINGKKHVIQEHSVYGKAINLDFQLDDKSFAELSEEDAPAMAPAISTTAFEHMMQVEQEKIADMLEEMKADICAQSVSAIIIAAKDDVISQSVEKIVVAPDVLAAIEDEAAEISSKNIERIVDSYGKKEHIKDEVVELMANTLQFETVTKAAELLAAQADKNIYQTTKENLEKKISILLSEVKVRVDHEVSLKVRLEIAAMKKNIGTWGYKKFILVSLWAIGMGILGSIGAHYLMR